MDRKTLGNINKAQGKDSSCLGLVLIYSVLRDIAPSLAS
jgi:hypothetical protein